MPPIPRHLRSLESALDALPDEFDPMLLTEVDGLLTGILVCPELIAPSDWLPMIWGSEDDDSDPAFASTEQMEELVGLVMEHYNATALDLAQGRFEPIFDVDTLSNEILWEMWMSGFEAAVSLRPESWAAVMESDDDTAMAFAGLATLADINRGESDLTEAQRDDLTANGHVLIPLWIETLYAARFQQRIGGKRPMPPVAKVGRNQPCPCGSGKKYKKCCGRN